MTTRDRSPSAAPFAAKIRPSASVIVWRRHPDDGALEVYAVRRAPALRFMGGWWAFPGGGQRRDDPEVVVRGTPHGVDAASFHPPDPAADDDDASHYGPDLAPGIVACAARELFEETGLLLVAPGDASDDRAHDDARRQLLDDRAGFADVLGALGGDGDATAPAVDASQLAFAGRWLTPPFGPLRFDNRFFLLEWPADRAVQPHVVRGELVAGAWLRPAQAVEAWQDGERHVPPPALHALRALAQVDPATFDPLADAADGETERDAATRDALVRLRAPHATHLGALRLAELSPGIVALPQPTPTLAPATHTNAILAGREHAVLIDPGATTWPDIQILLRALEAARDVHGRTLSAIWLTHHHDDHIGAAETVRSRFGVPICAHEDAARKLAGIGLRVDQTLDDGQQVTVSTDPLLTLEVLHTPGHAPGHCCFFDADRRVLLAGDLVSTLSTIVVVPPDGDMDAYLASLEKAAAREPILLIPAHGGPTLDGASRLRKTYAHRLWRESRIVEAWKNGHRTPDALVAVVYDDVPTRAHPIARRQLDAHLVRLRRSGAIDDAPV